ncbi:MAG TPA: intradiol ring-cleavage dioxygenase [Gemmatimonadaceae bacterium]|nr:intradiol ring-cleavage dioxygenase [Gemmatimonadaceae bacterium]
MDRDDVQIGTLLSRREMIVLLGASGIAALAGCKPSREIAERRVAAGAALPSCVVRPEQTEGPYFVDGRLDRSDIRSDPQSGAIKAGAPLQIAIVISRVGNDGACIPVPGARVDLWQCDADGVYSGVRDPSFDTTGQQFLRGYQVTDAEGTARFTTIYPGWYRGRTVHTHFKVRTEPSAPRGYEFTSQLYFDDALTDRVHARAPYASRGQRTIRNEGDGIFRRAGDQLMLDVTEAGQGYAGSFHVGLRIA